MKGGTSNPAGSAMLKAMWCGDFIGRFPLRPARFPASLRCCSLIAFLFLGLAAFGAASPEALFHEGAAAYRAADYAKAAQLFRLAASTRPAPGTLQNLGNSEWQRGQTGEAIRAWEQSAWFDPFNAAARNNLRFARKEAQLEAPELTWYEVVSTWLPPHWWAWIAGGSLWLAVGMTLLPGIFRRPKAGWHQTVAALGLMIFLLSLPANAGVHTRSRLGFVLRKDTPLRLTPTRDAQSVTRLAAGDPARWERIRGNYLLIRSSRVTGWVARDEFGLISSKD